jgi:hypothetical protein
MKAIFEGIEMLFGDIEAFQIVSPVMNKKCRTYLLLLDASKQKATVIEKKWGISACGFLKNPAVLLRH